jgi:hypothetical protein
METDDSSVNALVKQLDSLDLSRFSSARKQYEEIMNPYPTVVGKAISKKNRQEMNYKQSNLIYGEVVFDTLAIVLERIIKVYGLYFSYNLFKYRF